jgi:hypothetical protein
MSDRIITGKIYRKNFLGNFELFFGSVDPVWGIWTRLGVCKCFLGSTNPYRGLQILFKSADPFLGPANAFRVYKSFLGSADPCKRLLTQIYLVTNGP